ncbi:AAA family ATPase [Streptomyces exfoliatus]|uniref:AAA family ATPase n=1 Tax=Streptomyces exfoliatus TaxID=1905 RepID=UPI0004643B09|nr:AAA family ATPase [Streptomyces exfoliatus]
MRFVVQPEQRIPSVIGPRAAVLIPDSWDDRGYRTSYDLWIRPGDYARVIEIGRVKIALVDQGPGPSPLPSGDFNGRLPASMGEWISLGQDDVYYERLAELGHQAAGEILVGLGDVTVLGDDPTSGEPKLLALSKSSPVAAISLMRSVSLSTVIGQYRRITTGGPRLTRYKFNYHPPKSNREAPARPPLEFEVRPHSMPSSNIHVLIGRNGVGKTTILRSLATAAVRAFDPPGTAGKIHYIEDASFANVLLVTFSAFDPFAGITASHTTTRYTHVGLTQHVPDREADATQTARLKGRDELTDEFLDSLKSISSSGQYHRWVKAVVNLASDPQFATAVLGATPETLPNLAVTAFDTLLRPESKGRLTTGTGRPWRDVFMNLSSGHAIVLLTITRLVDLVAEQTLVLLDEPEAHLHPPLLSSFVRALSDLLTERNGVAITATHSPVVLQEVPKSCVYKISRNGSHWRARRPRIETYGENVGVLTHEIFGLEVMKSGFYAEIERAVARFDAYEDVLGHFEDQLGDEAKGLVRILLADKITGDR